MAKYATLNFCTRKKEQAMKKLIDAHTHIFPDAIAQRAADNIGNYYGIPMEGNGTASMLKGRSPKDVDCRYIISAAAMKAKNVITGNDFLLNCAKADSSFIPFGSFHPDMGEAEAVAEIERIAKAGAYGIKIHSDFQHLYIDEPKMMPMYRKCAELGLPVLFHVGDVNTDYSTPKRMHNLCMALPELKVIAAHLGGYSVWQEARDYLLGSEVYMDCSESVPYISEEETYGLIMSYGIDKVLFGSDFPVFCTDTYFKMIDRLPFTEEEKEKLYFKNAEKLLGLEG